MDTKLQKVSTGTWGFCPRCGEVTPVVMAAADRLQHRLVRAAWMKAEREGRPRLSPVAQLRMAISDLMVKVAVAKALANYGLVGDDPRKLSRSATIEVRRQMQEAMAALVTAEASLAEWLGEPVDLLREAAEELEKRVEQMAEVAHAENE